MSKRSPKSEVEVRDSIRPTSRLVVALVRGVRGLRGHVRVEVLTDRPDERFAQGAVLHPEGSERVLTVAEGTPVADGPGWWLRFREVPDRSTADTLRDTYLEADVAVAAERPDEVYWHELIGIRVRDQAGRDLGAIEDVYRAGETEVYVVGGGPVGRFDVPAVHAFVQVFEPRAGRIVVDAAALGLGETDETGEPA